MEPLEKESYRKTDEQDPPRLESHAVGTTQLVEQAGTRRAIKSRHAQMIAIGGTIGTGLFVGSGQALAIGGPGFLFLAYTLTSLLVYGVVTAIIEVCTYLPVSGSSMAYYGARFASPSLGFALSWLYVYSFGILVAYEITAAAIVINYWPNNVHIAVWITIILVVIVALNFSPVGIFAESEFWFAGIKVIMLVGLLLLAIILMLGGGPTGDRIGFRTWHDPGAIKEYVVGGASGRFTAFLYVWVFSGFSFYFGPELIITTSGEMYHPRKNLPIASRRFFYRLAFFYVFGALAIGAICRSDAQDLTSGAGNANASPWVIAIRNASISALPSVVNGGILTSAWSSGNSFLYMSSRSLYSAALAGNAPKIFKRCNSYGLPIYAVCATSLFSLLAYLSASSSAGTVFNWFISLTNTAGYTSWIVCCVIFIRFRKACTAQHVSVPYQSKVQPYGAYICLVVFTVLLLCNGFTLFYPGQFTTNGFLTTPLEMDLTTGLAEVEADAETWERMEVETRNAKKHGGARWKKLNCLWA
ncbi:hypothetical protein N0V91_004652 [Didymella pomorum]|uniref:Amino acid permease/ SLC12A domain-containing protein n=1 Tax=Didymella pomorum TaxID=749634 RepID=A0A9W8ZFL2_9PLEO|nr:hypothetical protein N0V91_004652 [Didymella pomorum]